LLYNSLYSFCEKIFFWLPKIGASVWLSLILASGKRDDIKHSKTRHIGKRDTSVWISNGYDHSISGPVFEW
jgi:hypothetical protein